MSNLPNQWVEASLLDIADLHDSKRIPLNSSERERRKGIYPYYGANGIVDHVDDFIFDGDFVLLAEDGGNFDKPERGVAYEAKGRFWVNNHAHVLAASDGIPNSFLCHLLNSIDWMPFVGGSTRLKLTQASMRKVRIALPPLPEQKRIVAKIDNLIARTTRADADLARIPVLVARYRSAILELAFSGRLTADFRGNDEPASHGIPHSWNICRLGDISEIQSGIQVGKKRHNQAELVEVPYLRVANVQRGYLNLGEIKTIFITLEEKNRLLLKKGDVLMNEGGDRDKLGRGWVWDEQIAECVHQNHVFRIRLNADSLPPEYVSHFANERGQQYFFDEGTQTTNLASISMRKVADLPVPVPPLDEAVEIVRRIEAAFAWLSRVGADQASASKLLPKLYTAILAKAFRGELVAQDPNEEPASALLERVKAKRSEQPQRSRGRASRKETKEGLMTLGKNLEQVLTEADDWIPGQTAFQRCGIGDGATTEDIERLYAQLRDLDRAGKLEAEAVTDSLGRKLYDRIRLKAI